MKDLAEHIGVILWITAGLLAICGILIGLIWNDNKKKWEETKNESKKFSEWLRETGEKGGRLVTEKLHFEFCEKERANCPACESYRLLIDWRNLMNEKGGPMLKLEHLAFCKEVTKEVTENFCKRLDEILRHHRELMTAELNLVRTEVAKGRGA